MPSCPTCGQDNQVGANFCRQCQDFLGWHAPTTGPESGPPTTPHATTPRSGSSVAPPSAPAVGDASFREQAPVAPGPPQQARTGPGRLGVAAFLAAARLDVDPGGRATTTIEVHNRGSVVDQVRITPLGSGAGWISCEPATVNLMPDTSETIRVAFDPPRAPRPRAGAIPFGVAVTSEQDPSVSAEVGGEVVVSPFRVLRGELTPRTIETHRTGSTTLTVSNRGNVVERLEVVGRDPDGRITFSPVPDTLVCNAGEDASSVVRLRANQRRSRREGPARLPFSVIVERSGLDEEPPVDLRGTLNQRASRVRWWWVAVATLLVALAFVAVPFILDLVGDGGQGADVVVPDVGVPDSEPVAEDPGVDDPGVDDPQVPAVSVVPPLVGGTVEAAISALEDAGLALGDQVRTTSDQVPGTILAQDPAPDTQVPPGTTVDVAVAADPPDLSVTLARCRVVAAQPQAILVLDVSVVNLQGDLPDQDITIQATTDFGLNGSVRTRPTPDAEPVGVGVELVAQAFAQTFDVTVTVDGDDEVAEVAEDNNAIVVRVALPAAPPDDQADVDCAQVG